MRFWKKVNRGLLLGGVLLFVLLVFVVIKELQFRAEAPEICDRAIAAVEELLELNVEGEEKTLGAVRPEATRRTQREKMEAMLTEYWDADAESNCTLNVERMRAAYETYLKSPALADFSGVELEVPVSAVSVRANGTDYAIVTFEISNLSAQYRGDGEEIFFGEYYETEYADVVSEGKYSASYEGHVMLELHRTGGVWRVCGMDGWVNTRHKTVIDTETGGGANG